MGLFSKIKNIFSKQEEVKKEFGNNEVKINNEQKEEIKETEKYVEGLSKSRDNFVNKLSVLDIKYTKVSDEFYDELEEILITADIGVNTVMDFVDRLKKRVKEEKSLAGKLSSIRNAVTYISLGIVAILFFVSLFIVSNTIRITIYNRRLEISIMKAVGATNSFIRWPFVVEGVFLGVISAVIALGIQYGVYSVALIWFKDVLAILGGTPVDFLNYIWYILAVFVFIGVIIGTFGSVFSLNKYLKEHKNVVEND